MVKVSLALVLTFAVFFVGGCLVAGKNYEVPRHAHKRYVFAVKHNEHVAFYSDHHFDDRRWPISCAIQVTDGQPAWYAADEYLRCPVCDDYVNHTNLKWDDLKANGSPATRGGENDLPATYTR